MKYVVTDNRGARLAQPINDRNEARKLARQQIKAGKTIMIFLATDDGEIARYSSTDTAAVYR